jgi:hypothetical protein
MPISQTASNAPLAVFGPFVGIPIVKAWMRMKELVVRSSSSFSFGLPLSTYISHLHTHVHYALH